MWNKNFLLLWQGLLISQIGSQLFNFALLYWILETTGSATLMGLVLMSAALPGVIFGPFAGTLADNISRKLLIVWADLIRGFVCLAFVLVLWFADSTWAIPALIVTQIIFGICNYLFTPAVGASVPDLVSKDRITSANSLIQGTNALTSTASYGFGGFLYAAIGGPLMFLINGLSYIASAITECFIHIEQKPPVKPMTRSNVVEKLKRETAEGFQHVWGNKGLRSLVAMVGLVNFVIVPTGIALPILVRDYLDRGPEFLGIMGACQAIGSLIGFIVVGAITVPAKWRPTIVITGMIISGLVVIALGSITTPIYTLPVLALFGFLLPLINVNIVSVIQGTTDSKVRDRVMGVLGTLILGLIPISQGLSGILIDAVDQQVPLIFTSIGTAFAVVVILMSFSPALRQYLAQDYINAAPSEHEEKQDKQN